MDYQKRTPVKIILVMLLITLISLRCTSIPVRDFTTYKEAFANTRAASEEVLLDYASALKEDQMDRAKRRTPKITTDAIERPDTFDPVKEAGDTVEKNAIEVRMEAWGVLARYNEVLTSLAEGKSAKELTLAIDGLATSLSNFPLDEITEAAGEFVPYIGILKAVIKQVELERTRQLFINAIKEAGPEIEKRFIPYLLEDARRFYNIRKALNNRYYDRIGDEVTRLSRQYQSAVKSYKPDKDLIKLTDEVNQLRAVLSLEAVKLNDRAVDPYDPIVFLQLSQIRDQIVTKIDEARQTTNELLAYQEMIVAYVKLINKLSKSLSILRAELEDNEIIIPTANDLVPVFIELKKAIQIYQDNRRH